MTSKPMTIQKDKTHLLRLVEEGGSVPVLSLPPSFSSFPSPESWSMSDSEFCIGSGPTVVGPGVTVSCSPSSGDTGGSDCVGKGIDYKVIC